MQKHCAGGEKTKAGRHSPAMQHPGFGAGLTGGEYAAALVQDFPETVTLFLGTTVLSVEPNKTAHLSGDRQISFSQLILATGSREIPLGRCRLREPVQRVSIQPVRCRR